MEPGLTIGKVASAAGVNVETVRYYQRCGLIPEPPRPPGGVRRYPAETVARLRFIKRAQELGFSSPKCGACSRSATRRAAARRALADLKRMREMLEALIRRCDAASGKVHCPIIESLAGRAGM